MALEWRRESWQPALIGNRWKEEVGVRRNDVKKCGAEVQQGGKNMERFM